MTDSINYASLMHQAMRGLMCSVLQGVAKDGHLPGEHHFFITLDTRHKGVEIAGWLRDRHPEEMTLVMQHEFYDLDVSDKGFSVKLSFGDQLEELVIPFDAIVSFVDPSVEFGLRFEVEDDEEENIPESPMVEVEEDRDEGVKKDAEVVSLDSFRKQ